MFPAVMPKRRVAYDSEIDSFSSAIVMMRLVRQFPFRLSRKSIVNDDSRNGGIPALFFKARMQRPRVVSETLMFIASVSFT